MKVFSISALLLAVYLAALGSYAWYERELLTVALGILPLVLITIVRALDRSSEKLPMSSPLQPGEYQRRV